VWRVKPYSATKGMSIEFQTLQFTMQSSSSHPVFVKSFHVNMRFYTSKVTLRAHSDQFLLTPHLLGEILWGAHDSSLSLMLYLNVRVGISMNFTLLAVAWSTNSI
jgi:hypothetical protein